MNAEWVLDVLSDLKTFSRENGLCGLSEHLDDAMVVAATEIRRKTNAGEQADAHAATSRKASQWAELCEIP